MSGEIWLQTLQAAKEVTYGTAVAVATRKLYYDSGSALKADAPSTEHHMATGRRDNVMAITHGAQMPTGNVSLPLSASETMELLNMLFGSPTTTTPGGGTTTRLHTYKPGIVVPESATLQWFDGAVGWRAAGVYANSFSIQGSAGGDNKASADLFGKSLVPTALNPAAGTLADRAPDFVQGWETSFALDLIGATVGTTNIPGTAINWNVQMGNQLGRKFTADNINAMNKAVIGEWVTGVDIMMEGVSATALAEFNHWLADDVAGRLVQLTFGNNDILEGALKSFFKVNVPGAWTTVDLSPVDAGTKSYMFHLGYMYDSVNGYGTQVQIQNARAAAWV